MGKHVPDMASNAIRPFEGIHDGMLGRIAFLFLVFLVGSPALFAADYEFRAGGLSLWLPDDWGIDITGKTMVGFSAGIETFLKLSLIADANNLEAAFQKYPRMLRPEIRAYRETQARSAAVIAGTEGLTAGGEGRANGSKQNIKVFVFKAPRAFVIMIWSVVAERSNDHTPIFERIVDSISQSHN